MMRLIFNRGYIRYLVILIIICRVNLTECVSHDILSRTNLYRSIISYQELRNNRLRNVQTNSFCVKNKRLLIIRGKEKVTIQLYGYGGRGFKSFSFTVTNPENLPALGSFPTTSDHRQF